MIDRRTFIKRLLGGVLLTSAGLYIPYEPKVIYSIPSKLRLKNYLLKGHLGVYEGITFHVHGKVEYKRLSDTVWREVKIGSFLNELIETGTDKVGLKNIITSF